MWETWFQSLGWDDPMVKGVATHSSILAWRIHGQRSLAGYSSWGHKELDTTERLPFTPITGQEATVRTGHGPTDWLQIEKGVHQGCIMSPCLFNLYADTPCEMLG